MNTFFVPSLGMRDSIELLDRLAASVDWEIPNKIILNNGIEDILTEWNDRHPGWKVVDSPTGNKGVADSWNWIARSYPDEMILIANEDCWFLPGQLAQICRCADQNPTEPVIYLNSSQAYYCFIWSAVGRKEIGEFDPNFFPSYYEDCDYRVRLRLTGKTEYVYALEGQPVVPHGKPKTGGINYSSMQQGCGLLNRTYWLRKWGSLDFDKATYQTPYKDHRLTVKDVVWYPEHRAKLFPLWEAFMEMNPSIYD